jgi:hypothetical protein
MARSPACCTGLEPDPAALWHEVAPRVDRTCGVPIVDDSTLDTPSARKIDPVTRHRSGEHRRVVRGIDLGALLWTDGECLIPVDYRIHAKERDGLTKDAHFRAMRGFAPGCIAFDSRYAARAGPRAIRARG